MSLDTRYIPLTTIWQLFTDKDTLAFLANGYAKFWVDTARTVGKPVYQITGSPPNYTYIEYGFLDTDGGWRVPINDQGAFDSIPYAFPYDENGAVELYFVQVYSSDAEVAGVLQFTREGLPNVSGSGPSGNEEVAVNFVPNPQFLLHLDIPKTETTVEGQVTQPVTDIAWGGWTYERPSSSTATDIITFERFGSDVTNPEKSPRYALRVQCESPSPGDTYKDICLKFNDVNKFSSGTQYFTFSFYGQVNSGSSLPASIILYKDYGTGGSTPTETVLSTVSIGTSYALYATSFIFGLNTAATIGTLNDDFLQIIVRLPLDSIFDVSVDDFNLAEGQISSPSMPYTSNSQMTYRSLAGFLPIPNPDGSDLYLPTVLTPSGMAFDHSVIGKIYATSYVTPKVGELPFDGSTYKYSDYSSDGIPYYRLGNVLWNPALNNYSFGTGSNFVSLSILSGATQNIKLTTNTAGLVTSTADGSAPTGFTFNNVKLGNNTYGMSANYTQSGTVFVKLNTVGLIAFVPASGTTSFSLSIQRNGPSINGLIAIGNITNASLAGKYFTLSNTVTHYYVWFKVDGAGTDPAPSGLTGIEIDLLSTYSNQNVGQAIADALSGRQISNIICTAGSSVPAGSYFNFYTLTQNYYAWYKVSGSGTDPNPPGKVGIKVEILSSDTNAIVATKTQIAVNKYQYAVPDARGMFIRVLDGGSGNDPDVANRFNNYSDSFGDEIGTMELDSNLSHNHQITTYGLSSYFVGDGGITVDVITSVNGNGTTAFDTDGRPESRPKNMYFQYIIKY